MEKRDNNVYSVTRSTCHPRKYYPRDFNLPSGTRGSRGPPSDVPNSEDSEMALGDPARDADLASDRHSNVANPGTDAGTETGVEEALDVRPAIKTLDAGSDTSLDGHSSSNTTAAYPTDPTEHAAGYTTSHNKQLPNEILYLQKLLDGSTRIVRKPGVLPMVCYVDASANVSQDERVDGGLKELEGAMSKLKIKEPPMYCIRKPDNDDFFQEG